MKTDRSCAALLLPLMLALLPAAHAAAPGGMVDTANFRGPAADNRAHLVGDLLTVLVMETTRARSGAVTGSERGTRIGASLSAPSTNYDAELDIHGRGRGAGETTRIGELRAQITVRVDAVEPNGTLHVNGTQSVLVNGEEQRIELSGFVRPEDITADNLVWSSRIAQAKVALAGKGVVSESQRRSVLMRVMHWLGL